MHDSDFAGGILREAKFGAMALAFTMCLAILFHGYDPQLAIHTFPGAYALYPNQKYYWAMEGGSLPLRHISFSNQT